MDRSKYKVVIVSKFFILFLPQNLSYKRFFYNIWKSWRDGGGGTII